MTTRLSPALVIAAMLGACQTTAAAAPAVLAHSDAVSMDRLKAALAKTMGRPVDLGPSDPTKTSVISVLPIPPGRQDDRSLAKPTLFHLEIEGQTCVLVRDDTGARSPLEGVTCRVAG